jgi:galactonate dehydratase
VTARRIVDVRPWVVGTGWRNLVFVEVETDDGIVGLGEATCEWFEEAVQAHVNSIARRYVLGRDPSEAERLVADVWRNDYWPTNVVLNSALAGIELACWDIVGQALDEPVYRLLGGACHEHIPCYANGWYRVPREPAPFAATAEEATARGYRALKLDPFGTGHLHLSDAELGEALDIVEAVRGAIGESVDLYVDAHGRFTAESARRVARALSAYNVGFIEEPVPPEALDALRRVGHDSPLPIAAGERVFSLHQAEQLLDTGAVDVFQPDPIHCGGLSATRRLAELAERRGTPVALHDSGGPVATAACLHLHVAMPNALVQEVFDDFEEAWLSDLVPGSPHPVDGALPRPESPGLGVRLNHDLARQHPYVPLDFHHWQEGWEQRASPVHTR